MGEEELVATIRQRAIELRSLRIKLSLLRSGKKAGRPRKVIPLAPDQLRGRVEQLRAEGLGYRTLSQRLSDEVGVQISKDYVSRLLRTTPQVVPA